ncbi:hypothetical protein Misp04_15380 [Micromonospora sp. NBRC 101691]|nr:hypothetical protein Misp04_15380 [Micromonospora sp. NBRC 101691]
MVVSEGHGQRITLLGRGGEQVAREGRPDGQPVVRALEFVQGDGVIEVDEGTGADDQGDRSRDTGSHLLDQGTERGGPGATGNEQQIPGRFGVEGQVGAVRRAEPEAVAGAYLLDQHG